MQLDEIIEAQMKMTPMINDLYIDIYKIFSSCLQICFTEIVLKQRINTFKEVPNKNDFDIPILRVIQKDGFRYLPLAYNVILTVTVCMMT